MAHAWAHVSPTVCTYDTHTFTGDPGISWERFVPLGWHTLALIQAECMVAKGTMIVASGGKTYKCASQVTTTAVKVPCQKLGGGGAPRRTEAADHLVRPPGLVA